MTAGMRLGWQVATVIMLLLCLLMMWQAWHLSLVDRLGPGPGFFPFWLGVIGAVLSLGILVQTTRRALVPSTEPLFPRERESLRRLAAIAGLVAIALALMPALGFRVTAFLFTVALVRALGARGWIGIVVFAAATSFGVFYVFGWLDVILPQGLLEELLVR